MPGYAAGSSTKSEVLIRIDRPSASRRLFRRRALDYLDEIGGADPLGESVADLLGGKRFVLFGGAHRLIERQSHQGALQQPFGDARLAGWGERNLAQKHRDGLLHLFLARHGGLQVAEVA